MMMETLGLIQTLEWRVADSLYLGVEGFDRQGNLFTLHIRKPDYFSLIVIIESGFLTKA